jgi:hypothetical protein
MPAAIFVCSSLCAIGRDIALVLHLYCRSGLTTRLHVIQAECLEKACSVYKGRWHSNVSPYPNRIERIEGA